MIKEASIVIPVFNEENNVVDLLKETADVAHPYFDRYEIIFVDDGSVDATYSKLIQAKTTFTCLRVIAHAKNYGQSVSIVTGVKMAKYPWIITMDGDGQNVPRDIITLYEAILNRNSTTNKIVISGQRINRKDKQFRMSASRLGNKIKNIVFDDNCIDTGCGLKLFSREVFLQVPHFNHMHRFLTVLFKAHNCEIVNIPVQHRERKHGESKYTVWGRFLNILYDAIGVKWLLARKVNPIIKSDKSSE